MSRIRARRAGRLSRALGWIGAVATATAMVVTIGAGGATAAVTDLGTANGVNYKKSEFALPVTPAAAEYSASNAYVLCNADAKAVSGGVDMDGFMDDSISTLTFGSTPASWWVHGWTTDYAAASTIADYAVCTKDVTPTRVSTPIANLTYGNVVGGIAWCPAGTSAVAGGFKGQGAADSFNLESSYPVDSAADADTLPDDGWRSSSYFQGSGYSETATADASCIPGPQPAYASKPLILGPTTSTTTKVACPAGRTAVGGGVDLDSTYWISRLVASRPYDNGDVGKVPDDGWLVRVRNLSKGSYPATAHAICR